MSLVIIDIDCRWEAERLDSALLTMPQSVQERAARYLVAGARRNLIATQSVLRQLLRFLEFEEEQLAVCPNGRPLLKDRDFAFNLSHSESRAILGVSRDTRLKQCLGVDLEWINRRVDRHALAKRFFTGTESDLVLDDPGSGRFFHIWTRKEAVLKTNGVGLRVPLDSFEVITDEVLPEVTGQPLFLRTESRHESYTVSWAVPLECRDLTVTWIDSADPQWLNAAKDALGR